MGEGALGPRIARTHAARLRVPLGNLEGVALAREIDVLRVDITDEDGCAGTGFAYSLHGGGAAALASARDLLAHCTDNVAIATPQALYGSIANEGQGRGAARPAMAAIDLALWDLHAKQRAVPLYAALGGESRAVPVYAGAGLWRDMSAEACIDKAQELIAAGFRAVKVRLAGNNSDKRRLEVLRAKLPKQVAIMCDANQRCDLARAQWLARLCGDLGVLWLEEPLSFADVEGYRRLSSTSPVSIAAGEHLQGTAEASVYFHRRAFAVFQPDLAMMGGLTECQRGANLAVEFGVAVAPHFLSYVFVHLAAAAPNVAWLEDFPLLEPLFDIENTIGPDGKMRPSETPGHGLRWAEGVERYVVA